MPESFCTRNATGYNIDYLLPAFPIELAPFERARFQGDSFDGGFNMAYVPELFNFVPRQKLY